MMYLDNGKNSVVGSQGVMETSKRQDEKPLYTNMSKYQTADQTEACRCNQI